MGTEIVFEEDCPHGNMRAIVEQNERVAYLYLQADERSTYPLRACWVRNLKRAPWRADKSAASGEPPMLQRKFCVHKGGQPPLQAESLEIIWFEEGDGAALLENGEVVVIIPAWAGQGGFPGYARDCVGESALCWKLESMEAMNARIQSARAFWSAWGTDPTPWPELQDSLLAAYQDVFGQHSNYYAIDGGSWPPRALIRWSDQERTVLLTAGVSLRPQPQVEMYFDDPSSARRIELGLCLDSSVSQSAVEDLSSYISGQATFPWRMLTFLGDGHTISCDCIPDSPDGLKHTAFLLKQHPAGGPGLELPSVDGDPVSILWFVAITDDERQQAMDEGSSQLQRSLGRRAGDWVQLRPTKDPS